MKKKKKKSMPENAKKVFAGKIFDVYQWPQEMFDGSTETFEKVVKKLDTASVIAFTEEGKVVVLEQEQPVRGKFFSIPGGMIDEGESPVEGVQREFLEEAGFECGEIKLWHSAQLTSKIDWTLYFFLAKDCRKVTEQKLDAGEKIQVYLVEWEEFLDMIFSGKMRGSEFLVKFLQENLLVIDQPKTAEKIKNYFENL